MLSAWLCIINGISHFSHFFLTVQVVCLVLIQNGMSANEQFGRISRTFQKLGNTIKQIRVQSIFQILSFINQLQLCLPYSPPLVEKINLLSLGSLPKCIELWLIIMMECSFKKDITPWCCHSFVRDLTRLELDLKFMKLKMNKNEMWQ